MSDWQDRLKADPTEWLLEPENPSVRYWTLLDILDRPPEDPEVCAAQAAIPTSAPVAELLAAQEKDGHWGSRDYYLPRASKGTFWVLTVLGDLGLTMEDEHVRRACDFMFTDQHEDGVFGRRRRVPGRGGCGKRTRVPALTRVLCAFSSSLVMARTRMCERP